MMESRLSKKSFGQPHRIGSKQEKTKNGIRMGYHPEKHSRRSTRLKGYDYASPGWYFVTICTHNRACLFGQINDGKMILNKSGRIARDQWQNTESIRDNVLLDAFIIMPNHLHGIVQITGSNNNTGADSAGAYNVGAYRDTPLHYTPLRNNKPTHQSEFRSPSNTLGAIVRGYKSAVTTRINMKNNTPGRKVWQRNYHNHIIRDNQSLERIRHYVRNNPRHWKKDENNPKNF